MNESAQNRVAICGANWLGDAVMSMPALQRFRENEPAAHVTMLSKPGLMGLWRLHPAVDACVPLPPGRAGAVDAARLLRGLACGRAIVVPNSFRSALIPWLAGIPERTGFAGHWRRALLTRVPATPQALHQSREYATLFDLDADAVLPPPRLALDGIDLDRFTPRLGNIRTQALAALMPGAARGPSKRWSADRFADVGRRLVAAFGCRALVLGSATEREVCASVARGVGPAAVSLAGETSLAELAGFLRSCLVAVCNDSGGMHLAAACGTPVAAVFGVTDPERTGPLGSRSRIVRAAGVKGSRNVPCDSRLAREALASIPAEAVTRAALEVACAPERRE